MTLWFYGALLLAGVVLLAATILRVLVGGLDHGPDRPGRGTGLSGGRARQLLDERYAAGELGTEEYQRRRHTLEEGS